MLVMAIIETYNGGYGQAVHFDPVLGFFSAGSTNLMNLA